MAEDYARETDSPRSIEIEGKTWMVSRLTPRDMGDLQAYLKEVVPDPRLMARELCAGMSDEVAKAIWADLSGEAKGWPPSFGSTEGNRILLYTSEGNARLLWALLRRHNRGVDLDRARELAEVIDLDTLNRLVVMALPEYASDPKARTTAKATA